MEKSFEEFLQMSGYGGYVWTAFGLTLAILLLLFLSSRSQFKRKLHDIKRRNSA